MFSHLESTFIGFLSIIFWVSVSLVSLVGNYTHHSCLLKMPEQSTGTQGVGEYCRRIVQWILCTWTPVIPSIIGIAAWISGHLASPNSEQLGGSSILRRTELIRVKFWDILEHAVRYALPYSPTTQKSANFTVVCDEPGELFTTNYRTYSGQTKVTYISERVLSSFY